MSLHVHLRRFFPQNGVPRPILYFAAIMGWQILFELVFGRSMRIGLVSILSFVLCLVLTVETVKIRYIYQWLTVRQLLPIFNFHVTLLASNINVTVAFSLTENGVSRFKGCQIAGIRILMPLKPRV